MATYYKGTLRLNSELNESSLYLGKSWTESFNCCEQFKEHWLKLSYGDKKCLNIFLLELNYGEYNQKVDNQKVIDIFEKIYKMKYIYDEKSHYFEIIFEKFKDEDGISYGKELHTGLIFPLFERNDYVERIYNIKKTRVGSSRFYELYIVNEYKVPSLDLCEVLIFDCKIADQNEVLDYQNMFSTFGKKRQRRNFENTVREWYNKNVYNREVVPCIEEPKKKEIISQSSETKVMDSIEYLLMQLKRINIDLYNKYLKEYGELLNGLNDEMVLKVIPSTLIAFHSLEASIKVDLLSLKNNADNILEYLNKLQKEYLINILTGSEKETSITFLELEKLNELFLKAKNHYGFLEQRNVLKKIAFLYLMELIENIDNIDEYDLENSYFVDSLKTILVHIEILRELGIIESNVLVDLNQELSVSSILEIIKTIEFNKFSKKESLELVKKL